MDINTPVGRLVQGKLSMQHRKDMSTNQPLFNKDGTPNMGLFFSVAFPKVLPNGQANTEFTTFYQTLTQVAAAAWPQFFPQGATGACTNPKFSWKLQDGDGSDTNGKSVADKPGFKGHWVVKFDTDYPVRVFHEGKFGAHEEIQKPEEVVKRGFWIRVFGEAKSNNADISKQQVPGISLYPKLVSFVERGEEILSGPDAQAAFGAGITGFRPPVSASPIGGLPGLGAPALGAPALGAPALGAPALGAPATVGNMPGLQLPAVGVPGLALPTPPASIAAPALPSYIVRADLAAQGYTLDTLKASGTIEQLLAAGYITQVAAAPTPAGISLPMLGAPSASAPALGGLPGLGALGGLPGLGALGGLPGLGAPRYQLTQAALAMVPGITIEKLISEGWTHDALVQAGYAVKIG